MADRLTGEQPSGGLPAAVRRRLDPEARFGLRLSLALVGLILVAVPFAALLISVRRDGVLLDLDRSVATGLHGWLRDHDTTATGLKVVSAIGTFAGLGTLVIVAAGVLLRSGRRRLLAFLLATTVGGWVLNNAVKLAVGRQRPTFDDPLATARGLSFPSGHAMSSTVVLGALLMVFLPALRPSRRTPVVLATAGLVLLIGFTRLALGVHYLTDVVAGLVLGGAWLALCVAAFSVWRVERGRRPVDPLEGLEPEASGALRDAAH
ncbi:MAG TPA: phosphatase PAP2 family protein [Mycobacteriales bacterium]|nr:phosphatase PAP2 family protein [Mycobacteriales bacterium]